jgi:hypothetical protein
MPSVNTLGPLAITSGKRDAPKSPPPQTEIPASRRRYPRWPKPTSLQRFRKSVGRERGRPAPSVGRRGNDER